MYKLTSLVLFLFLDIDEDYLFPDALVDNIVNFPPGCTLNVKRCESMSCNKLPTETCSDEMVVCESMTETRQVECSGISYSVDFAIECACACFARTVLIIGKVIGSDTDSPKEGINVILNGQTNTYLTDVNGQFSLSVSSTVRRLILKATDPNNNYNAAFLVTDIPVDYQDTVFVTIVMVKKAPFIQINSAQENELAMSASPSEQGTGVASIRIPANAFFTLDGTPYTGQVSVSLTYLDPLDPDMLAIMPGRFVTLNADGEETILVTQGVFSISFEDNVGNELIITREIEVHGKPGSVLWEFEQSTATWIEINVNPGRKRRQVTQQQYLGSFNPQSISWMNIDRRLLEPGCFFKIRIFQGSIAPTNELLSGLRFVPEVSQLLANGTELVNYFSYPRSSPCINIKCPSAISQATIRIRGLEAVYGGAEIQAPLLPANISDYSTEIRSVMEASPYFYSLLENDKNTIFINTPLNESGPFYLTEQTCINANINDTAFWFIKKSSHVQSDFDDAFQGRCAAKIYITYWQQPAFNESVFSLLNLTAVSSWGDNQYAISTTGMDFVEYGDASFEVNYESCFEYRCSHADGIFNDTSTVVLGVLEGMYCNIDWLTNVVPILDPNDLPTGFFYSNTTNPQLAMNECLSSGNNYTGTFFCFYDP